jgi:hypothetical protein
MMTFLRLHILDETPHPSPKPFLSLETLRRLAWSVWFLDATLDGGNFGFSTIGDGAITIQLPSDERPFLLHQSVTTEPLMPRDAASQNATLGLAAHLIRAMHARQILADAHSRIQRKLIPRDSIADLVRHTSNEARAILDTLPPEMRYSRIQYHAYRDQRSMLVHLHVMRNTCERHLGLLRMLSLEHASPELQGASGLTDIGLDGDDQRAHEAQDIRKRLIADAIALSGIMSDALAYEVIFDPQMAMHSYNGIEGGCRDQRSAVTDASATIPAHAAGHGADRGVYIEGGRCKVSEAPTGGRAWSCGGQQPRRTDCECPIAILSSPADEEEMGVMRERWLIVSDPKLSTG